MKMVTARLCPKVLAMWLSAMTLFSSLAYAQESAGPPPPPAGETASADEEEALARLLLDDDPRKQFLAALAERNPARKVTALKAVLGPLAEPDKVWVRRFMDAAIEAADGSTEVLQRDIDWSLANIEIDNPDLYQMWAEATLKHADWLRFSEKLATDALTTSEKELETLRLRQRGDFLDTLGRTQIAQGRNDDGRKTLNEALELNPDMEMAAIALAKLEAASGNRDKALNYAARAWWDAQTTDDEHAELRQIFAKLHGGSLETIEQWLDTEHRKLFPNPIKTTPYVAKEGVISGAKPVLLEVFTSASCGPCQAADLATDAAMERYKDGVTVLMYHQHVPRPDALANSDSEARGNSYDITGTPTVFVNGARTEAIGGSRRLAAQSFERLSSAIEVAPKAGPRIATTGNAVLKGNAISVEISVTADELPPAARVQVALVERQLSHDGGNSIRFHPMVVRDMAEDGDGEQGFEIAGKTRTLTYRFDLAKVSKTIREYLDDFEVRYREEEDEDFKFSGKARMSAIDASQLRVVAFVQDVAESKVLHVLNMTVTAAP